MGERIEEAFLRRKENGGGVDDGLKGRYIPPEGMPMEQRTARRVVPGEPIQARLQPGVRVRVLDLSPRGLQVELPVPLPLRRTVEVKFQTDRGELEVRAVVRRCRVQGRAREGSVEGNLLYRAGLELLRPAPALLSALGVERRQIGEGDLRIPERKSRDKP